MNKPDPSAYRKSARHWNLFFGEFGILKGVITTKPTVSVFLGFLSSATEYLVTLAKSKDFISIRPGGSYYKVLDL
jgi:hypothetical protein